MKGELVSDRKIVQWVGMEVATALVGVTLNAAAFAFVSDFSIPVDAGGTDEQRFGEPC